MDPIAKSKAGDQIVIDHPIGGIRNCAEIFLHPAGIVFVDIGWFQPLVSWNPYHLVEGAIEGVGPWTIGTSRLYVPDPRGPHDDLVMIEEWGAWSAHKSEGGDAATREAAARAVRRAGFLITE